MPVGPRPEFIEKPTALVAMLRPKQAQNLREWMEELQQPHIYSVPPTRMVTVRTTGRPGEGGGRAYRALLNVLFGPRSRGRVVKKMPRARLPQGYTRMRPEDLVVTFAVPIPDGVTVTEEALRRARDYEVKVEEWADGEAAEILHVGPYEGIPATAEKLVAYARNQGYEIVGEEEQEYHVARTLLSQGNPADYTTLVRYRVRRR